MIGLLIKKCAQWAIYSAWHNQHPLISVQPQLWNYRPAFRLWQILVAIDESVTTRRPLVLSTIFQFIFTHREKHCLLYPFAEIKSKFSHLNSAIKHFVDEKLLLYFCSKFSLDHHVSFEKTIFRPILVDLTGVKSFVSLNAYLITYLRKLIYLCIRP